MINSPFFCNRVFTLIFATFRSRNSIMSFHAFVLQFNFQYIEYWSNNHTLLPQISTVIFPQNSFITKQIKVAPLVPKTKEQATIKRNNEHFYYILIIFQLPVHAQPSGNIFSHRHLQRATACHSAIQINGQKLPLTKIVKGNYYPT